MDHRRDGACLAQLYDLRLASGPLGTQTATAIITDRQDVNNYESHWAELEPFVSYDDVARAAIERVAADYRGLI